MTKIYLWNEDGVYTNGIPFTSIYHLQVYHLQWFTGKWYLLVYTIYFLGIYWCIYCIYLLVYHVYQDFFGDVYTPAEILAVYPPEIGWNMASRRRVKLESITPMICIDGN